MLSISHLIIIFLVALIVFGPEKLPELARALSKAMFEFNRATGSLKQTLQDEMRQLEREIDEKRTMRPPAPPVSPSLPAESAAESAPGSAKPVPGSTTEESPSPAPAGDDGPASEPTSGKPSNGHSTAA
ncbi:MAG: twin-arginine translocase TatA/TatE family subunit [Acidobacteriota bacterium]|nr:twin-arginine translocase TatA/TatE family subunit [Acidobacteriota bacterium]